MKKKTLDHIVTGAAGHLGGTVVRLLHKRGLPVRGLLRPGETPPVAGLPYVYGDVRDAGSLRPLFEDAGADRIAVIHTAGIVGIADTPDPVMHDVNVNGTSTVAALCAEYGARMVYVSSVHAIPENGALRVLTEYRRLLARSGAGLVRQKQGRSHAQRTRRRAGAGAGRRRRASGRASSARIRRTTTSCS